MKLSKQKWIKGLNKNFSMHEFKKTILPEAIRVYSQTVDERIKSFIGIENLEWIYAEDAYKDEQMLDSIKSYFNCLSLQDDILMFSKEGLLCAIPFRYAILYPLLEELDSYLSDVQDQITKEKLCLLIQYDITKDLQYLHKLIQQDLTVPYEIFELLKNAAAIDDYNYILNIFKNNTLSPINRFENAAFAAYEQKKKILYDKKISNIVNTVMNKPQKKNLIVLHLESISNEIYFNHKDRLENLTTLLNRSMNLTRFYSSASSSIMSLFDLFYGNDYETDRYESFDELHHKESYTTHLFQIFQDNGYNTLGIGFNEVPLVEETNRSNVWNVEGQKYKWVENFDVFLNETTNFIHMSKNENKPFAMHVWNLLTHSGHVNDETKKALVYDQKISLSISSVDLMIKTIMDYLHTNELMDDTIVVCYGDHGDDLWTRSINSGFTHVTPPHMNLIWTPAAIYDSRIKPFLFNDLASMIDLKNTILFLMGIENTDYFPYQGINLLTKKNKYIYSRSLLFNQKENSKINSSAMIRLNNYQNEEFKNKTLHVISEKYNLLAGKDGLEMYLYLTDPWNYNNLLNFIEFDKNFVPRRFLNYGAWRGHFRKIMMQDEQIYDLLLNFAQLKKQIMLLIDLKENMLKKENKNAFTKDSLKKIRYRGFLNK